MVAASAGGARLGLGPAAEVDVGQDACAADRCDGRGVFHTPGPFAHHRLAHRSFDESRQVRAGDRGDLDGEIVGNGYSCHKVTIVRAGPHRSTRALVRRAVAAGTGPIFTRASPTRHVTGK